MHVNLLTGCVCSSKWQPQQWFLKKVSGWEIIKKDTSWGFLSNLLFLYVSIQILGFKSHTCAGYYRYYWKKGVLLNFSLDAYQLLEIKSHWFCHLTIFEDSPSWWGTLYKGEINHIIVNSVVFIDTFLSYSDTKQPWELTKSFLSLQKLQAHIR